MAYIEINIKISKSDFPVLDTIKKKDLNKILLNIIQTGYDIHYPSVNKIENNIEYKELLYNIQSFKEEFKTQLNNSEIKEKMGLLETSLNKLIGLSSNSSKKGNLAENILEDIFSKRYGDIQFERKSQVAHSGDAWLYLPDNKIIMLESKNYTTVVNKDEILKLQSDMINHHIRYGLLISFNSLIQGMKEMDLYTFIHNKETYSVICISNLSNDLHKLDLGIQILRKLINHLDLSESDWIFKDVNQGLTELNQIIQKNYVLKDSFYNMEKEMHKLLANYHIILRDYQYEIENKIKEIIGKINNDSSETHIEILNKYKDKKILLLLDRFIDIVKVKKWDFAYDEDADKWIINKNAKYIGFFKIQTKKILLKFVDNEYKLILDDNDNNKLIFDIIKKMN